MFINSVLEQKDPNAANTPPLQGTFWIGLRQKDCPAGNASFSQLQFEDGSCPVHLGTGLTINITACRTCVILDKVYTGSSPPTPVSMKAIECAAAGHRYICEELMYADGKLLRCFAYRKVPISVSPHTHRASWKIGIGSGIFE